MKILLVQLYSNGDCLFATTIARQIKNDFPGCNLTWAISSFNSSIIENNPFVDQILKVDSVVKNDVKSFRNFVHHAFKEKQSGVYDEVFVVHNADKNNAYFDGSIRGSILNAYPYSITVPIQPVLRNTEQEIIHVEHFVKSHSLEKFKNVILFEFAPQSGQIDMSTELAVSIAESLVSDGETAVILSSANRISHANEAIIDGSSLSFRETAKLSHYCNFLLGCSSGITWITTSDAGKLLPMVQLLNPRVRWFNPISFDFKRFGIDFDKVIELVNYDQSIIVDCVKTALHDFYKAKLKYNQSFKVGFRTSRTIIYNFLLSADFTSILKHIKINIQHNGLKFDFMREVSLAFLLFPFYFIKVKLLKKENLRL